LERYLRSTDPDFEAKAAEIIGLYLAPPQHAAVFCVDEKTAIQALDRRDPILPLSPGRAERHGFEYVRHGTLSLYAALETQSGMVLGKTAERHTSDEFVAFLDQIVTSQPATSAAVGILGVKGSLVRIQSSRPINATSYGLPPAGRFCCGVKFGVNPHAQCYRGIHSMHSKSSA
jgi:hypothetical protein